jgi:hypothetical protein
MKLTFKDLQTNKVYYLPASNTWVCDDDIKLGFYSNTHFLLIAKSYWGNKELTLTTLMPQGIRTFYVNEDSNCDYLKVME